MTLHDVLRELVRRHGAGDHGWTDRALAAVDAHEASQPTAPEPDAEVKQ